MKRLLSAFCVSLALPALALAQSSAEPSMHVALQPCQVYSGSLAANTNADISVRGVCNVPTSATAVEMAVTVAATCSGSLKLWEYDGTAPSAAIVAYDAGTESSLAVPRLCSPSGECYLDVSARSTAAVSLTLVVVGYYAPPVAE